MSHTVKVNGLHYSERITINGKRYDLKGMEKLGVETPYIHGVKTVEIYYGPRSKRIIRKTDSIWEDKSRPGCCEGTKYTVFEPGDPDYPFIVQWLETYDIYLDDAPLPIVTEED